MKRIWSFFIAPVIQRRTLRDLEVAAQLKLQAIRKQTEEQLVAALSERKMYDETQVRTAHYRHQIDLTVSCLSCSFSLNLNVKAPTLWVPQSHSDCNAPLLLLVLGSLSVSSDLSASEMAKGSSKQQLGANGSPQQEQDRQQPQEHRTSAPKSLRDMFLYNKYDMKLQEISAILTTLSKHQLQAPDIAAAGAVGAASAAAPTAATTKGEDGALETSAISRVALIPPFNVDAILQICRIQSDDFPLIKLSGQLPSLIGFITAQQVTDAYRIIDSVLLGNDGSKPASAATSAPASHTGPPSTAAASASTSASVSQLEPYQPPLEVDAAAEEDEFALLGSDQQLPPTEVPVVDEAESVKQQADVQFSIPQLNVRAIC